MLDFSLLVASLTAFLIGLGGTQIVRRIALRWEFVDAPDQRRKLHQAPIPLGGGLVVWLATWSGWSLSLLGGARHERAVADGAWFFAALALATFVVLGVGVFDDRYGLRGRHKLAGQVVAAVILAGLGLKIDALSCFGFDLPLGSFAYPVTVFWVLLVVNAFNLIDGMDGFCSSLGLVAALAINVLACWTGRAGDAILGLALAGALAAFLVHNLPPARIYLGDAGSLVLGMMVAALSVRVCSDGPGTAVSCLPLAALVTLPLLDVLTAVTRRWLTGRTLFTPDRSHLHHCLRARLGSTPVALGAGVGLATFAAAAAVLVQARVVGDLATGLAIAACVALLVGTNTFGGSEARLLGCRLQTLLARLCIGSSRAGRREGIRQECHLHGIRDWATVWDTLVRHGQSSGLRRIELSIDMTAAGEVYHGLWTLPEAPDDGPGWAVVHTLHAGGVPAATLQVAGCVDTSRARYLDKVAELVRLIEGHLEALPPAATATASTAPTPAPLRPASPRRPSRRNRREQASREAPIGPEGARQFSPGVALGYPVCPFQGLKTPLLGELLIPQRSFRMTTLDPTRTAPAPAPSRHPAVAPSGTTTSPGPGTGAWAEGGAGGPDRSGLRVVHLGKYFHPAHGGIERSVRTLAHEQAKLGCRVRVICMDHERGRATREERDGPVEVVRMRRAASFFKLDHCPDLIRRIRESDADLFHLHAPNPSMILAWTLSGDRRPLVVSHHSDVIKQRLRRVLFAPLERACYDRAKLVLAMSSSYVAGSRLLQRCAERVAVLPIGIDLAPFLHPSPETVAQAASLRRSYPGPLWFTCGRLVYYKGLETALHALRAVPGTLLIGGDGPAPPGLERLAARLGLKDRVRFLGRIPRDEDLIAHHHAADAFWFPSNARSEAYGLVQVEAMASGCPVINTTIPHSGVPWVSRHEETGLTVPVNAPPAFAAAARRIWEEPGLRKRLAEGARARAIAEFPCENMGRRSMALYAATLGTSGRDANSSGPSYL